MTEDLEEAASRPIFFLFEFAKYMTTVSFVLLGAMATYCLTNNNVSISDLLIGVFGLSFSLGLSFISILLLVHQFGKAGASDALIRLLMKFASLSMAGGFAAFATAVVERLPNAT